MDDPLINVLTLIGVVLTLIINGLIAAILWRRLKGRDRIE